MNTRFFLAVVAPITSLYAAILEYRRSGNTMWVGGWRSGWYLGSGACYYCGQPADVSFVAYQAWGFALQPEVRFMIPFGLTGIGAIVAGRFRFTTQTESFPISFFTMAIGLEFIK